MKTTSFIAASAFALTGLVGAAPVKDKRQISYFTATEDIWETVWTTTTLWVNPTKAEKPTTPTGGFYEQHSAGSSAASSATTSSSVSSAVVTTSTSSIVPVSTPVVAPVVSTSLSSVYIAPPEPKTTTTPVAVEAPAPTTTSIAPVPTTTTSVAPAATTSAAATLEQASTSTTGDHSGDLTYYDVQVGLGSCGIQSENSQMVVAMNSADMANGANPNSNPHCGQKINIYYNGETHQGTVEDTCPTCAEGSIDVTNTLFSLVAPNGNGRVHGVSWSWA